MSKDLEERLKSLDIEDLIWITYLGIIVLCLYSNNKERDYFINKNENSKIRYEKINVLIFSILVIVYLYFLKDSFKNFINLKNTDSPQKQKLVTLSFIGSLLIAISGFIFLYIVIVDDNLDVEVAFD